LRKLEPHQINGMETYSTVLFHLQDEVALSTLAQDMVEIDKHCAQVMVVYLHCLSVFVFISLQTLNTYFVDFEATDAMDIFY